ncbi:MAG TPA: PaaI family thioesterase [Gaiellaceae bacterium]|nr:PaaI family thioesterase [Gaiellaceae bacterium]
MQIPPHHDPACFGCGDNPLGLRLAAPAAPGLTEYEAYFSFDERHQGGPGIAHGGMVSAALDEAAGLLATWHSFPSVTARLFVRYRRPVPINTELLIAARLVDVHGRRLHVDARITDGDESLAEAKVALLHVPLEHFLATPEGRAAASRWSAEDLPDAADAGGEQSRGA